MKPIPALVIFVAGLLTGTALTWFAVGPPQPRSPYVRPPSGDDDVTETPEPDKADVSNVGVVEVARTEIKDHGAWPKLGFVEMFPPLRLPSDGEGRDKIEVWLRIPDGGLVTARLLGDGRRTIRFPPGTVADRVESWGYAKGDDGRWRYTVTDVRGTRLGDGVEFFHVFTSTGPEPLSPLVGWEWQRGDALQQRAATSFLVNHLETLPTVDARGRPQSAEVRREMIEDLRSNNSCAECHGHNKPPAKGRGRTIHRGTDDNGFYVPLTVLMDRAPIEKHRPRDMNVGDPFIRFKCPNGDDALLAEGLDGARDYRCLEGGWPEGILDVPAGLAAKDPHVLALCRSRKYLRDHMDDDARALFADAFTACAL